MFSDLLWRDPQCDCPQINFLIRLDARENEKYSYNKKS